MILILVLLGPGLGGLAYRVARDRQQEQQRSRIEDQVAERAYALRQKTLSVVDTLRTLKAFFDYSEDVTRDEFAEYAGDARLRHPSIQTTGWIPYVPAESRDAHERFVRDRGFAGYEIRERAESGEAVAASAREAYYPLCYVEPNEGDETFLGLDLGSEAHMRRALDLADDSCEAILTDPHETCAVPSDACDVLGILAVRESAGCEQIHDPGALRGFVLVTCRASQLAIATHREVTNGGDAEVEIRLLDADVDGRPVPLYEPAGWPSGAEDLLAVRAKDIRVAGQTWRVEGRPTASFLESRRSYQPFFVAAVAFLLWELLCGFLILLGKRAGDRADRKQAGFIRSVLQSVSEGVVVADRQGRVQLANDAAERMVGTEAGAGPAAQRPSELGCYLPDAETPCPVEQMPMVRAIQGQQVVDEDMFVRKATTESGVWLSVSASPIHDETEGVTGGVVVYRDITERKKSEAAILRLSEAVEQTADAVIITDRRGRIEYVNAAFEETTGYTRDEVLGDTPRLFGPESYTDEQYQNLWRTIIRGNVYRTSSTNRRKDGGAYYVEQTITPMRDAHGRVTHFVSVARDVTEKKLRREQEFEMRLAAKVQQRLFPQASPRVEGLDVAGAMFPAAETSGDYFDYIEMPDGALVLAIGDVSGHGFGPALLMAETRAYLRSLLQAHASLDTVLDRLNHSLLVDLRSEHFVTLLLARIDREAGTLVHASAGHVSGHILDASGAVKAELVGTGPILGIFEDRSYTCGAPVSVVPGDIVVFLTDGVTEAKGESDTYFGCGRALDVVREHRDEPAQEIVQHLYRAVREFSCVDDLADDTTVVICKVV